MLIVGCNNPLGSTSIVGEDWDSDSGWTCGGMPEGVIVPIDTASLATTEEVFMVVDQPARFPSPLGDLDVLIEAHVRYPNEGETDKIEGIVYVRVIVERDGRLTNLEIIQGLRPEFDREALRVVGLMPRWSPGRIAEQVVRSYAMIRVKFALPK